MNIERLCELIFLIRDMDIYLQKGRRSFYDGGYTFEECYKSDIEDFDNWKTELKDILKDVLQ